MTKDSDPSTSDPTQQAFFEAIGLGQADEIRTLVAEHPTLISAANEQGLSPVLWAIYNRKPELISLLKQLGAGEGPFEYAAQGSQDALVALLEGDSSLLSARAQDGFTLLHMACFFGHEDLVLKLIEMGADVRATSSGPEALTPLHAAAAGGSISASAKLLDAGADPDAVQKGGFTALMSAAGQGNQALANSLLRAGATLDQKAEDGRTALDIAKLAGQKKLVNFLSSR